LARVANARQLEPSYFPATRLLCISFSCFLQAQPAYDRTTPVLQRSPFGTTAVELSPIFGYSPRLTGII